MTRKTFLTLIILIVVALLVGFIVPKQQAKKSVVEETAGPYQVTVVGKMVCLPHKDTTGPVTLECLYGLQTPDGTYYALDMSKITTSINEAMSGNDILIYGYLTPLDQISSNQWDKYNIQGLIEVDTITPTGPNGNTL